jgi:hypothetical protein
MNSKQFDSLMVTLMRAYFRACLRGSVKMITGSELETDGRKRKSVVNALRKDGYIGDRINDPKWEHFALTDRILNVWAPVKPDLQAAFDSAIAKRRNYVAQGRDLRCFGVPVDDYGPKELRYLVEHHDEFTFRVASQYRTDEAHDVVWGSVESYGSIVLVSDDAYDKRVADLQRADRIDRLKHGNVAWGLEHLRGVPGDIAALVSWSDQEDLQPFSDATRPTVRPGREWSEEFQRALNATRAKIASLTQQLEALHAIDLAVTKGGGWRAFERDLETRIAAAVDGDADEDAA